MIRTLALVLVLGLCGLVACSSDAPTLEPGRWRAWLDSPGGELPFGLELTQQGETWNATILNGPERLEIEQVIVEGDRIRLDILHFDAHIEATLSAPGTLSGRWWKTGQLGAISELPFHARHGLARRFSDQNEGTPQDAEAFAGRWAVRFASESDTAVAEFQTAEGSVVHGTFLTTTGDYRYLAGSATGERLRLSTFDGAHAFLFDATRNTDGTIEGQFWSRDSWHDTWTAQRDPDAALVSPTDQVRWVDEASVADVAYPDLDGVSRSLNDPQFAGRARIVEVFGTWCPNCNDATAYLVELHRRYADRGLSIVGLAFEMSGDFDRDAAQVRVYREHHGIDYPILLAGTSDKSDASEAFPLIDQVKSYPTTIFLHADGRVHSIYSGFSGPATGAAHEELKQTFEQTIEELLGEP